MSSVIVAGDVSGSVSLTAPSAAGSTVITLPSTSGTMLLSGGAISGTTGTFSGAVTATKITQSAAPCFGAYISSIQVPHSTTAELAVTEIYDPTNAYATNGRFTPQTAGYYLVSANCNFPISGTGLVVINAEMYITKNGTTQTLGAFSNENTGMINTANVGCSKVIYLNGTTDYVSLKGYQYTYAGSNTWSFSQISFQAHLIGV
jgi:hypothetical protein